MSVEINQEKLNQVTPEVVVPVEASDFASEVGSSSISTQQVTTPVFPVQSRPVTAEPKVSPGLSITSGSKDIDSGDTWGTLIASKQQGVEPENL